MSTRTAIVINLDYEHAPQDLCESLWENICQVMQANGFIYSGRLFLHDKSPEIALPLARGLVESLEIHLEFHERRFHRYIKDFYGFGYKNITNLMTPCARDIEVRYSA
jgi:hypothetical protein